MGSETDDTDVPKLPRGRGLKFSVPEIFRILITLSLLVALIVLAKPCSRSVSKFVMGFGSGSGTGSGSGSAKPDPYERLTPGMTDEEVKAAIERSKAKNAAQAGSGLAPDDTGSAVAPRRVTPIDPAAATGSGSAANSGSAAVGSGSANANFVRHSAFHAAPNTPAAGSAATPAAP
ncbi:MAG TPA: hypothetical protein VF403_15640 [Kofleriaceae bacterium]